MRERDKFIVFCIGFILALAAACGFIAYDTPYAESCPCDSQSVCCVNAD